MMMGSSRKAVGALLSVIFLCFLLLVSLSDGNYRRDNNITIPLRRSAKFLKNVQTEERGVLLHHLNFVSKRRVPNGPDPIHNKRIGDSRSPPT